MKDLDFYILNQMVRAIGRADFETLARNYQTCQEFGKYDHSPNARLWRQLGRILINEIASRNPQEKP